MKAGPLFFLHTPSQPEPAILTASREKKHKTTMLVQLLFSNEGWSSFLPAYSAIEEGEGAAYQRTLAQRGRKSTIQRQYEP
ncbi:hypothetical protein SAY87_028515 [Trapa incisa]|uniref:Uncharacterized protein n=1 Tax=Trapa incisa TaxID=236973 RepID=A0AAN7L290_9MYRT|nr:hypothetical protein SAY87_028515 [Trapa incisa]